MSARSSTHSTRRAIFATAITCAGLVSTVAFVTGSLARPHHGDTHAVSRLDCYVIGSTIVCTPATRPDTAVIIR